MSPKEESPIENQRSSLRSSSTDREKREIFDKKVTFSKSSMKRKSSKSRDEKKDTLPVQVFTAPE